MNPGQIFDKSVKNLKKKFEFKDACEIAKHVIERARVIMFQYTPFTNGYLTRLPIRFHKDIPTAGVTKNGIVVFNPWAVIHWSKDDGQGDETASVLYHEILHVFFEHMKQTENLRMDPNLSNIAQDLVIDQEVVNSGFPKIEIGVFPGEGVFEKFPLNLNSERYYELLLKDIEKRQSQQKLQQKKQKKSSNQTENKDNEQESEQEPENEGGNTPSDSGPPSGKGKQKKKGKGTGKNKSGKSTGSNENASNEEADESPESDIENEKDVDDDPFGDMKFKCGSGAGGAEQDWEKEIDGSFSSKIDLEAAKEDMATDILRHHSKNPGSVSSLLARHAELLQKPRIVDWRKIVKRVLNDTITYSKGASDHSYSRLNRRQESVGGCGVNVPRLVSMIGARSRVAVAFDTSGSVCSEDLVQYVLELDELVKKCDTEVSLYVCDCEAAKICDSFKSVADTLGKLVGGGGTSFDPIFTKIEEERKNRRKYKTLIYFTDGYAAIPQNQPDYLNVIWIIVNGEDPGLKGKVVHIDTQNGTSKGN